MHIGYLPLHTAPAGRAVFSGRVSNQALRDLQKQVDDATVLMVTKPDSGVFELFNAHHELMRLINDKGETGQKLESDCAEAYELLLRSLRLGGHIRAGDADIQALARQKAPQMSEELLRIRYGTFS